MLTTQRPGFAHEILCGDFFGFNIGAQWRSALRPKPNTRPVVMSPFRYALPMP